MNLTTIIIIVIFTLIFIVGTYFIFGSSSRPSGPSGPNDVCHCPNGCDVNGNCITPSAGCTGGFTGANCQCNINLKPTTVNSCIGDGIVCGPTGWEPSVVENCGDLYAINGGSLAEWQTSCKLSSSCPTDGKFVYTPKCEDGDGKINLSCDQTCSMDTKNSSCNNCPNTCDCVLCGQEYNWHCHGSPLNRECVVSDFGIHQYPIDGGLSWYNSDRDTEPVYPTIDNKQCLTGKPNSTVFPYTLLQGDGNYNNYSIIGSADGVLNYTDNISNSTFIPTGSDNYMTYNVIIDPTKDLDVDKNLIKPEEKRVIVNDQVFKDGKGCMIHNPDFTDFCTLTNDQGSIHQYKFDLNGTNILNNNSGKPYYLGDKYACVCGTYISDFNGTTKKYVGNKCEYGDKICEYGQVVDNDGKCDASKNLDDYTQRLIYVVKNLNVAKCRTFEDDENVWFQWNILKNIVNKPSQESLDAFTNAWNTYMTTITQLPCCKNSTDPNKGPCCPKTGCI